MQLEITENSSYYDVMRAWLWSQMAIKDAELTAAEMADGGDHAGAIQGLVEGLTEAAISASILERHAEFPEPGLN